VRYCWRLAAAHSELLLQSRNAGRTYRGWPRPTSAVAWRSGPIRRRLVSVLPDNAHWGHAAAGELRPLWRQKTGRCAVSARGTDGTCYSPHRGWQVTGRRKCCTTRGNHPLSFALAPPELIDWKLRTVAGKLVYNLSGITSGSRTAGGGSPHWRRAARRGPGPSVACRFPSIATTRAKLWERWRGRSGRPYLRELVDQAGPVCSRETARHWSDPRGASFDNIPGPRSDSQAGPQTLALETFQPPEAHCRGTVQGCSEAWMITTCMLFFLSRDGLRTTTHVLRFGRIIDRIGSG